MCNVSTSTQKSNEGLQLPAPATQNTKAGNAARTEAMGLSPEARLAQQIIFLEGESSNNISSGARKLRDSALQYGHRDKNGQFISPEETNVTDKLYWENQLRWLNRR